MCPSEALLAVSKGLLLSLSRSPVGGLEADLPVAMQAAFAVQQGFVRYLFAAEWAALVALAPGPDAPQVEAMSALQSQVRPFRQINCAFGFWEKAICTHFSPYRSSFDLAVRPDAHYSGIWKRVGDALAGAGGRGRFCWLDGGLAGGLVMVSPADCISGSAFFAKEDNEDEDKGAAGHACSYLQCQSSTAVALVAAL